VSIRNTRIGGDNTSSCCYSSHDAGGCVGVGEGETVLSRRGDPKIQISGYETCVENVMH
jgi:hypothetical protein